LAILKALIEFVNCQTDSLCKCKQQAFEIYSFYNFILKR
jgi:hypothetical protein